MTIALGMNRIAKKIPGVLPPPPKSEIDGKISDLSSKTIPELLELRDRQLKLLNNKGFISKLHDKGSKIQSLYDKILTEIKKKHQEEETCSLFNKLNIHSDNDQLIQNVEWEGRIDNQNRTILDSDDDSEPEDVIHILSQNTSQEKKIVEVPPDKPLITPEGLVAIGEIPYVKYLVDKTENIQNTKRSGQFKPYKTTKSNSHDPNKEINRKKHKNWEVTAATPPPIVHGPVKTLSLEESLQLQKQYNIHIKEIELKHATERLLARSGHQMPELPQNTAVFGKYRDQDTDSDDCSDLGSDKEVHDDEPDRGGVVFTIME